MGLLCIQPLSARMPDHELLRITPVHTCQTNRYMRIVVRLTLITAAVLIAAAVCAAQPAQYRTFSQTEFASKKLKKVGTVQSIRAWFTFHNDSAFAVNSLHVKFNGHVLAV